MLVAVVNELLNVATPVTDKVLEACNSPATVRLLTAVEEATKIAPAVWVERPVSAEVPLTVKFPFVERFPLASNVLLNVEDAVTSKFSESVN